MGTQQYGLEEMSIGAHALSSSHYGSGGESGQKTQEVLGQCAQCHDIFTVLLLIHPTGGKSVQATSRLHIHPDPERPGSFSLVHRPGFCDGKVTLYGI